jgi:hypothetical protein
LLVSTVDNRALIEELRHGYERLSARITAIEEVLYEKEPRVAF